MSGENGLIIDPNLLFVARTPPPKSQPTSARSNISSKYPERMQFGLAWLNLTYAPQNFISNKTKTILRHISGQIKFGEITAIMGPSGCGKSTLLRCINGRIVSDLSAETKFYVSTSRPIHSCFIVQDQKEHLLMDLTTKEVLLYASKIKNNVIEPNEQDNSINASNEKSNSGKILSVRSILHSIGIRKMKKFDHKSNIQKLMTDLTLNDCADTMVSNCSGGQQKRIVIALELAAQNKPNIMCIDEPTSGLDSNAAEQVIECLRNICRDHSIGIIMTIHQPNSDILYMFDALYVLAKGGYNVFNGRPQNLRAFLLDSNIFIKEIQVPIEVLMKLVSKTTFDDINSEEFEVHEDVKLLADKTMKGVEELRQKCHAFGKLTEPKNITIKSIAFNFLDLWVLTERTAKCSLVRGWKVILFLTIFELCAGQFNAYLFGESGVGDGCLDFDPSLPMNMTCIPMESMGLSKKESSTVKNFKLLYFVVMTHNFLQMCFTILTYPMEVKLFFNEQQNRWYSTGAYFWAKNLIDSLIGTLITITFVIPIYVTTGQIGTIFEKPFAWYLLSQILAILCNQGMCSIISIIAVRNFSLCMILGIGGMLLNTILSGFLITVNDMDQIIQSISYVSFVRLSFEMQIYALYGFNRCDPKENQWSVILYQLDLNEDGFYTNLYLLVFYAVLWRLLALICLIIKTNEWNPIPNKNSYHKKNEIVFINDGSEII